MRHFATLCRKIMITQFPLCDNMRLFLVILTNDNSDFLRKTRHLRKMGGFSSGTSAQVMVINGEVYEFQMIFGIWGTPSLAFARYIY